MHRQINNEEPLSPILPHSHSRSTPKSQLSQILLAFSKDQLKGMSGISQKCSSMELMIASIQILVSRVGERVQRVTQKKESDLLGNLRMKQNEFIINELKGSLSKQVKKEQRLSEELDCERKKLQKFREQIYKLQAKNHSLSQKTNRIEYIIKQKEDQIERLNTKINKQKQENQLQLKNKIRNSQVSQLGETTSIYLQFQSKIEELEKELQNKVTVLEGRNRDLNISFKKVQEQLEQEQALSKISIKKLDEMNRSKYELQLKLRQSSQLNSELQDSYNKLLQKNKNSQITLHKQIQQFKTKQITLRNQFKKEKKNYKQYLSDIAEYVNGGSKYYLVGSGVGQQVEEIKKLVEKTNRKRVEVQTRQSEYYQAECKKLRIKKQQIQVTLNQLQKKQKQDSSKALYMSEREVEKREVSDKNDRRSDNGSLINRSTDRSEEDRSKNVEEKYRVKLQVLKKDLKVKQTRINQLQKLQQIQFDKSKQRILQLQLTLSQKGNQIRKFDVKTKQKEYQLTQLKTSIRQLQNRIIYLTEKIQTEKESNTKILQMKVQNYEQKIRNIKGNHKQLQKRQQQKTIKYNKLKMRYEKYELQASQSLKRKNLQLDQLLKQKNKLKTENRLLQQKININNIIEKQVNSNKTPTPVNQDLIEQIEMQRDRISSQLYEKQKQCSQIIEVNTKMSSQILTLKRELREVKNRGEELGKDNRYLQEENRFAKEKIEELKEKKNQEAEESHSYFKKELEKNINNLKKLEQTCQKIKNDKKSLKNDIQQLNGEMVSLRGTMDKLKDKNAKLSDEVLDEKDLRRKVIADYQIKLSECNTRQSQLVDIINYKNREEQSGDIRDSMKGEELLDEYKKNKAENMRQHRETTTEDLVYYADTSMNTDAMEEYGIQRGIKMEAIIPSQILMEQNIDYEEQLGQSGPLNKKIQEKAYEVPKQINYFNDLIMGEEQNLEDHFDICDQQDEININRASLKLQIKDVFNSVRQVIEKVLNQQDISMGEVRVLPKQLEDDFNQFISYVKQKIYDIKNENNLSFIMAEGGSEPEQIQDEITDFIKKKTPEYMRLRKIIEQKQYEISSLMNQKTEQQNTINQMTLQKQQFQEQNQNRFMNQCHIYKKQIKEYKKLVDILEMNCQSLKNIFKNTLELWVDENDNEDDIRDNMVLFGTICKLSEVQKKKMEICLQKYREMKT